MSRSDNNRIMKMLEYDDGARRVISDAGGGRIRAANAVIFCDPLKCFPVAAKKPDVGWNEQKSDLGEQDAEQHKRLHVPCGRRKGGRELGEESRRSLDGNMAAGICVYHSK